MTYTADDFANDETWLEARYAAALERVGGSKSNPRDPITAFMIGAAWGREEAEKRPRPLTPDDITDEMVERAREAWRASSEIGAELWRVVLRAALTEPPARPEGAEEIQTILMSADMEGGEAYRTDGYKGMADYLAARLTFAPKEQP